MSIEQDDNRTFFVCDGCGVCEELEDVSFSHGWAELKQDGWRAYKDRHDRWNHKCPDCMSGPKSQSVYRRPPLKKE